MAARTRSITLATTSYLLPIRHPLLAAEQIAALDHLCGGRLLVGLGRGFQAGMLRAFGVDGRHKRDLFEETLGIMQRAWRGEPVGDEAVPVELAPLPLQQPHPPLWVAAFGPKAISQAGRLGLPYLASPMETLEELVQNLRLYRESAADAATDTPPEVAIMRTVFISEDPARLEQVRDGLAATPRPQFAQDRTPAPADWSLAGSAAEVEDKLAHYRAELGMTHMVAVRPRIRGLEESWLRESMERLRDIQAP